MFSVGLMFVHDGENCGRDLGGICRRLWLKKPGRCLEEIVD